MSKGTPVKKEATPLKRVDENRNEPKLFGLYPIPIPSFVITLVTWFLRFALLYHLLYVAYDIRMYAIKQFGYLIHEFDPWFNYRATVYLLHNGAERFFTWFDYMSWYPLGRPVGTTIYPGMQFTAVWIYQFLEAYGNPMPLINVCCMVPVWFGVIATIFLGLFTYEIYGSVNAAIISSFIMAMIPAHIMRSVGGGFDNESIAISAMVATFYFWVLSLRNDSFWPVGILTGLSYAYMVAAWGGYIFVLNMVCFHAGFLLVVNQIRGKHSHSLHRAFTLFYVIGTAGAVMVPVVGWTPFKSLEQLGAFALFILFQLAEVAQFLSQQSGFAPGSREERQLKLKVLGASLVAGVILVAFVVPSGYFGPISSRVRGLFLQHTRTGNPLVDSVAEHQPGTAKDYERMLLNVYGLIPIGLVMVFMNTPQLWQSSFLILYTLIAFYFATKMSRLMLLLGPVGSALGGIAISGVFDWVVANIYISPASLTPETAEVAQDKKQKLKHVQKKLLDPLRDQFNLMVAFYNSPKGYQARLVLVAIICLFAVTSLRPLKFEETCYYTAAQFSHPMIVFHAGSRLITDYLDSYNFLKEKTPADSRVMAWWDYGYQITGIGNRTTIADGNTWNHEHIATLGYCLTSPVARSHELIRHLADYVYVWSSDQQGDLGKSPHMARIGNSVYHDICPGDPTCRHFGFNEEVTDHRLRTNTKPTPMMQKSLLYNLIKGGDAPDAYVDPRFYKLVYTSENRLVKIYQVVDVDQASKAWSADPANRVCDRNGSWYCVGQYPPAKPIQDLMKQKTDFAQLEDFNKKGGNNKNAEKYHEEYMKKMGNLHEKRG
jgi:dolichyl-diphosphooligosaccharide--protein glycosyltransferase